MSFRENEFKAELHHKGFSTNAEFLKAYNTKYKKISSPAFYNKLRGRSEWKRSEISNIAELLGSSWDDIQRIFFAI